MSSVVAEPVSINTTDTAEHVGQELKDMTAEEEDDYIEQLAAQIACLAVKLPEAYILQAVKRAYVVLQVPPKSKYEYNNERKRDVKVCKAAVEVVAAVSTEIEKSNQSVYGQLYADPSLYIRNYQLKSYGKLIKALDPRYTTFDRIQKIDLADQQIGDARLDVLCGALRGSPVEVISLVNCDIGDNGLCNSLSGLLRGLFELKELYLNQNLFGDRGVESLFRDDTYSRTLRLINISRNSFTSKSALYIGSMFVVPVQAEPPAPPADAARAAPTTANVQAAMAAAVTAVEGADGAPAPVAAPPPVEKSVRVCKLEAVFAGGILCNRNGGEGDRFVRTLCGQLMTPNARPIKELHVPDMALGDSQGLRSLAALIAVSPGLRTVNITRNAITTATTKTFFYLALMLNKDLQNLMMGQCGLEYADLKSFELLKRKNRQLRGKQEELERERSASISELQAQKALQMPTASSTIDRYRLQSMSESVAGAATGAEGDVAHSHPVVKVGNVLTWHEKVTGGLMIAKEASTNEQIRYRLNLEIYNLWKAIKPIETPARIAHPYEAYKALMRSRRLSFDPLAYLIKPTPQLDSSSRPGTGVGASASRPTSPNSPDTGATVAFGGDSDAVAAEEEEIPVDNSAEMKFLPLDVEVSLRCALIFSDYITMFLEPDRQVALTFIRPLSEEEIIAYRDELGAVAAVDDEEEAKQKKKAARIEKARKRASEKVVPQISPSVVAGVGLGSFSAVSTARRGSNSSVGSVRSDSTGTSGENDAFQVMIPGEVGTNQFIIPFNMTAARILGKNELVLTRHMDSYLETRDAAEKRIEKRRASASFSRLFMTVCVDKYVTTMKNRSSRNPGKVRASAVSGWASKASRKTASMTPALVSMAIEDYHASLMELSTETEQSMAKIHQAFVTCIDAAGSKAPARTAKKSPSLRGSSIKVKSDAGILNASNKLAINDLFNYRSLDLAGYYVACVCHSVPRERERFVEAGKKAVEDAKIDKILDARVQAKSAKKATAFKIGPRFMIYTAKNPRPTETEEEKQHLVDINAHHKPLPGLGVDVAVRSESTRFGMFNAAMSSKTAAFFRRFNGDSEKGTRAGGGGGGAVEEEEVNAAQDTDTDAAGAGVGAGAATGASATAADTLVYEVVVVQGEAGLGLLVARGTDPGAALRVVQSTSALRIVQVDAEAGGDISAGDALVSIDGEDISGWATEQVLARLAGDRLSVGSSVSLRFARPTGTRVGAEATLDTEAVAVMLGVTFTAEEPATEVVPLNAFSADAVAAADAVAPGATGTDTDSKHSKHKRKHKHKHNSETDDVAATPGSAGPSGGTSASPSRPPSGLGSRAPSELMTQALVPYKSKYFKIPTVYRRPHNSGGYENASPDELHFLCSESLDGLNLAQSRANRRFLISIHANTIWSRLQRPAVPVDAVDGAPDGERALKDDEGPDSVSGHSSAPSTADGLKGRGRTRTSSSFRDGGVVAAAASAPARTAGAAPGTAVEGRGRTRTSSSFRDGSALAPPPGTAAASDPNVYSRTKARTNTSFWYVEPPAGLPGRPGVKDTASAIPTPALVMYAEVECNRSEPIGSMEHFDIWRLKVHSDERKRLLQERRMKAHEEMLK